MKKIILLICTFIVSINLVHSQGINVGDVYVLNYQGEIDGIFYDFNVSTNSCNSTNKPYNAGRFIRFVVENTNVSDADKVEVLIQNNDANGDSDRYAIYEKRYCISKSIINSYFKLINHLDHGALSIPFKLRFNPNDIFPGGSLGYYLGSRRYFKGSNVTTTIGGFLTLTTISLSDTGSAKSPNSTIPSTQLGVSAGLMWTWKIDQGFEAGIVSGVDFFNGADTWVYKYNPWVAFSIGFSFTSSSNSHTATSAPTIKIQ